MNNAKYLLFTTWHIVDCDLAGLPAAAAMAAIKAMHTPLMSCQKSHSVTLSATLVWIFCLYVHSLPRSLLVVGARVHGSQI